MRRESSKVLIALERSTISRSKKLSGIFRAAADFGDVELEIMEDGRLLTPKSVDEALVRGIRGFVIGATGIIPAINQIMHRSVPLALISIPCNGNLKTAIIRSGNRDVAKEAARHFLSANIYKSYAYFPTEEKCEWSDMRYRGFQESLGPREHKIHLLQRNGLANTLRTLPRPLAILAANDNCAMEILACCRKNKLSIPQGVSVIGVDNDVILCDNATPTLTSIEPDFEKEGYEALSAVHAMLSAHPPKKPISVTCGVRRIVIRKSTVSTHRPIALVQRALEYIDQNATEGIDVSDVCKRLGASRRLLDLRFRELQGRTVIDAIVTRRLEALKRELKASDDSIAEICRRTGWTSENHPKKVFRQRFGMSMREFRNSI